MHGPDEPISLGPILIRFRVEPAEAGGSVSMFECTVPAGSRVPAPHGHDGFEETIYGLEGVSSWTIAGQAVEIGAGDCVCIPRGTIHGFDNTSGSDARFLAIATPGVFGPAYFRELAALLADGPPDPDAVAVVMRRHGLTPAPPVAA